MPLPEERKKEEEGTKRGTERIEFRYPPIFFFSEKTSKVHQGSGFTFDPFSQMLFPSDIYI
ncbi:hypothetical protein, partial [uncultured Bacteroides sp.]|uniref:hypothetical protein n=1 Tax=uncultured Bacteroides sp. TaxID=162156 RepID=UPI002622A18C